VNPGLNPGFGVLRFGLRHKKLWYTLWYSAFTLIGFEVRPIFFLFFKSRHRHNFVKTIEPAGGRRDTEKDPDTGVLIPFI
jgi:hypothetical protein